MENVVIAGVPKIIFINATDNSIIETCLDVLNYKKKNNIIKFTCAYPHELNNSLLEENKILIKVVFGKYCTNDGHKLEDYIEQFYVSFIKKYVCKATCNTAAVIKFIVGTEW